MTPLRLDPATSARMLGVWFAADGKGVHTKQIVKQEVSSICKVLARKAITDKQATYIVNNVLIPRILYRLITTILTPHEINKIVGQYSGMIRQKLGFPRGTPNSILHHRCLYGLRHFGDVQEEEQISTALLRLNDHGLVGQVTEARSLAHQAECSLPIPPCHVPEIGARYTKSNLWGHICRLMVQRKVDFSRPDSVNDDNPLMATILPAKTYRRVARQLARDKVVRLSDVVNEDGTVIASWVDLRQRLGIKGKARAWYKEICRTICRQSDIQDIDSDSNDSGSSIAYSTESEDNYGDHIINDVHDDGADDNMIINDDNATHTAMQWLATDSETEDEPLEDPRKRRRAALLARQQGDDSGNNPPTPVDICGSEGPEVLATPATEMFNTDDLWNSLLIDVVAADAKDEETQCSDEEERDGSTVHE
ncbi:hypothetical protein BGZ79_000096, partial [Entomortierella chlamydospora]